MSSEMVSLARCDLTDLKCASCLSYLSVPPITLKDDEYYCGRCDIEGTRIEVYEKLASFMLFPCIYEPCPRQLKWGSVANHELNCPYKLILCPFINCKDCYRVSSIITHFEEDHPSHTYFENEITFTRRLRNLYFDQFTIDKRVYAINYDNMKYVLMVYIDAKEHFRYKTIDKYDFSFGVYSVQGRTTTREYNVYIEVEWDSGHTKSWEITDQPISEFDDDQHCLHCIQGNCSKEDHDNEQHNFLTSKFRNFVNRGDMEVTFTIEIVD